MKTAAQFTELADYLSRTNEWVVNELGERTEDALWDENVGELVDAIRYEVLLQTKRPTLGTKAREALAEIDTIVKGKARGRCTWELTPFPNQTYCPKKATVYVGCSLCTEHGIQMEADRIAHEIYRETGRHLERAA